MKRILLMDDSPIFLDVARFALESASYEVACANDLAQLHDLRTTPVDLVLMDVQMPEAYGDDVALTLRHMYGIHAPIYLLSSLPDSELDACARWAQIEGYISKNQGIDAVVGAVQRILQATVDAE